MNYEELDQGTKKWVDEKLATLSSEEEKNAFCSFNSVQASVNL